MGTSTFFNAKHTLLIGVAGSGKSTFLQNLLKDSSKKYMYVSMHNEEFGEVPCLVIDEPTDIAVVSSRIKEYIATALSENKSFVIKIPFGHTGQLNGIIYYHEVLVEILNQNKEFGVILDDTNIIAQSEYKETYKNLLTQKIFPAISVFQYFTEENKYVLDYMEQICIYKISPTAFPYLEERGLLSKNDANVMEQKTGEFIVRTQSYLSE